jgi:hypothetical protein
VWIKHQLLVTRKLAQIVHLIMSAQAYVVISRRGHVRLIIPMEMFQYYVQKLQASVVWPVNFVGQNMLQLVN